MFGSEILPVERKSFRELVKYIKAVDAEKQTVIALQIENEAGILGAARDFSPYAEEEYGKEIPVSLAEHIERAGNHSLKKAGNNREMMPVVTKYYGTDKMIGLVQNAGCMTKRIRLGKYRMAVEFYHEIDDGNEYIPGAGTVIQQSGEELLFIGYGYRICPETETAGKQMDYLSLEKGAYDENAKWVPYMVLNGDEQRIQMEERPTVLRAVFYEF